MGDALGWGHGIPGPWREECRRHGVPASIGALGPHVSSVTGPGVQLPPDRQWLQNRAPTRGTGQVMEVGHSGMVLVVLVVCGVVVLFQSLSLSHVNLQMN